MDISQQLAFAVKEEIIRNVLKSHQRILVLGLSGTGKTICTLRAVQGIGTPCYFSPDSAGRDAAATVLPGIVLLSELSGIPPADASQPLLIIDDLSSMPQTTLEVVTSLLKKPDRWFKIVLLSRMLVGSREFMPNIDVVVKMKEKTAEMMFSNLSLPEQT